MAQQDRPTKRFQPTRNRLLVGWVLSLLLTAMALAGVPADRAAAAEPIILEEATQALHFGRQVKYLKDPTGQLTLADVRQPNRSWQSADQTGLNFGFTSAAYWFRFTLDDQSGRTNPKWYLELTYPLLDRVDLYAPQRHGGGFEVIRTGDHQPFYERPIIDKNFVFLLTPPAGPTTYYLRIRTQTSLNFEPILYSPRGYVHKLNTVYPLYWLYFGAMLIMVIYNLVLYGLIRETNIIYLALFILTFFLLQFALNGFAFQYLWPNAIWWASNCIPILIGLSILLLLLFIENFNNLQEIVPDPRYNTYGRLAIMAPNAVWPFITLFTGHYALNIKVAIFLAAYSIIAVVLFGGLVVVRKGPGMTRAVRFVALSCSVMAGGVLLFILKTVGLLPTNFITEWSIQIGSTIFIALLSIGLADKLTALKNSLIATNANISLMLQSISQKDEQQKANITNFGEEEIGDVLQARFETFMGKFKELVEDVRGNADILNSSSTGLFDLSDKMNAETGDMSTRADSVASASEEMSAKMTTIAGTMEQTDQNVSLIASSTEEMTTTVQEITTNTETARRTTANAVSQSEDVSRQVDALGEAADKIGMVTETITEISKKTNLLALNATIEAARAGEAGQGFAVVAGEIKDLARQTAASTQQIKHQIEENREITSVAVAEIKQISQIINQVDEIVSTIASSIEEQSSSTREIASNVSQISQGVSETTKQVAQCSQFANTVSRDVASLSDSTQKMDDNSQQIKKSASELSAIADYLAALMQKFQTE